MANPRADRLRDEFQKIRDAIDALEASATAEDRDLSEEEQSDVDALVARADALRAELEPIAARERSIAATAEVLSRIGNGPARSSAAATKGHTRAAADATPPEAGEYLAEYFRAAATTLPGGEPNFDRPERMAAFVEKYRTVADQLTTDNAGILPKPIVGQLISFLDGSRPCFDSFTSVPMPAAGKSFARPRITQHVSVDEQTTEKTQLASQKMTITSSDVTKRTFGGTLDISQQDIDWTDPSIMTLVLQDFVDVYGQITEGEACDALEGMVTSNTSPWTFADTGEVLTSFVDAAVAVYGTAKVMPDTLWLSLDSWADLAALTDGQDRPLFPGLGAGSITVSDAGISGAPLGLRVVVAPQLASGTKILGVKRLIEAYEQRKGLVQAVNVPLFGVDVAYAGYVAFYGRAEGFVGLV